MKRIGLAERTGRGIDRIFEGSLLFGRTLPDYSQSSSTYVKLFIPKGPTDKAFIKMISDEQQRIGRTLPIYSLLAMNALKELHRASVHDISVHIHYDESRTRSILEMLTDSGLIEAGGNGRGRYYMLGAKYYNATNNTTGYIRNKDIDTMRHEELLLQLAKNKGFVTRADAMELLHLTPQQASRLLQKLASPEKNKLHLRGHGAGAKYYIE